MWQDLAAELASFGVDVITIGIDVDPAACHPYMDRAAATLAQGNALVDTAHATVGALNFRNVPMAMWVDADGLVVLGAHQSPVTPGWGDRPIPEGIPPRMAGRLQVLAAATDRHQEYLTALRRWARDGTVPTADAASTTESQSVAAAAFELGDRFRRDGDTASMVAAWQAAHRADPANWAAKRQAWSLVTSAEGAPRDLVQEDTGPYEGNWLDDVVAAGGIAGYYPPNPW